MNDFGRFPSLRTSVQCLAGSLVQGSAQATDLGFQNIVRLEDLVVDYAAVLLKGISCALRMGRSPFVTQKPLLRDNGCVGREPSHGTPEHFPDLGSGPDIGLSEAGDVQEHLSVAGG